MKNKLNREVITNFSIVPESNSRELQFAKSEFERSIIHARKSGVPEQHILKSKEEIDDFFKGGN